MKYNYTGEYIADGKTAGKALMCLAVNDSYNMDTVDAEIAIYEYWHLHNQAPVIVDSIIDAARQYLNKIGYVDFARKCLCNRKTLDNRDNRIKYMGLCSALHVLLMRATNAIVAQASALSHIAPSEILSDDDITKIVDACPTYIG